jgi:hypothetical protein
MVSDDKFYSLNPSPHYRRIELEGCSWNEVQILLVENSEMEKIENCRHK